MPSISPSGALVIPVRVVNPATGLSATGRFRIDTGDDVTLIDPALARAVGALAAGSSGVIGVGGGIEQDPQYVLDLDLGDAGYVAGVQCIGQSVAALGYDGLLGDNVLDLGLLVRDGPAGQFTLVVGPPSPARQSALGTDIAVAAVALGVAAVVAGLVL
jgi:hypothetical protein